MPPTEETQFALPTSAIEKLPATESDRWFEYIVRVHPHHTDYAGVVWHGTYVAWMEEARMESLHAIGINYAELVALGCELPVVEMSLRYHRPVKMGMAVVVKTRMADTKGIRWDWDYQICSLDGRELYVTARMTLVPIDRDKGKIMRQLPQVIQDALSKLSTEKLN